MSNAIEIKIIQNPEGGGGVELLVPSWAMSAEDLIRAGTASLLAQLRQAGVLFDGPETALRRCRSCGCTDERGCPGGCWWVASDLCSECQ